MLDLVSEVDSLQVSASLRAESRDLIGSRCGGGGAWCALRHTATRSLAVDIRANQMSPPPRAPTSPDRGVAMEDLADRASEARRDQHTARWLRRDGLQIE